MGYILVFFHLASKTTTTTTELTYFDKMDYKGKNGLMIEVCAFQQSGLPTAITAHGADNGLKNGHTYIEVKLE
jgi:hypothetical protein